ncbi:MAG: nickel pincer cofactor biosynthesis protein LarB [Actinomycetota bacterium]
MRPEELKVLLRGVESGEVSIEEAVRSLTALPVEDIDMARIDVHRELRQGMPEAIYAEGKTTEQVAKIAEVLLEKNTGPVLATRVPPEMASDLIRRFPQATHHGQARLVIFREHDEAVLGDIAVVCAGTSDLPVAEEAALVAEAAGARVERITDVGVAGLHRLLSVQDRLHEADVVIVVAGMEGALASLVGGITASPVVAVPTSVGYGASFEGMAALLAMLNSCSAGIAVMNIDNGFGAAMFSLRLLRAAAA